MAIKLIGVYFKLANISMIGHEVTAKRLEAFCITPFPPWCRITYSVDRRL